MTTPQVADHSQLEVVEQVSKPYALQHYSMEPSAAPQSEYHLRGYNGDSQSRKTICGFQLSKFLLSIALVCVIIAATVGGGVGGSIAVRNAKK
jgi:hypothetical protein